MSTIETLRDIGLGDVLSNTLLPIVKDVSDRTGNHLLQVLHKEFELKNQMDIIRRIVVMEAGDIVHSFYTYLFFLVSFLLI